MLKEMKNALKFTRGALVATAVVIFAAIAVVIFNNVLSGGEISSHPKKESKILFQYLVVLLFFGILLAPLLIGYLLVLRDTAGMPSIGFAVGVIPPTLLFAYYQFDPPSGGISAVMTILFIPILAIVSGVVMAVLPALVRGIVSLMRIRPPPSL
jgi:hypothetical protein